MEPVTDKPKIRISVRNLVAFLLQSGDITQGRSLKQEREAMQLGQKLHRKIQKSMPSSYKAEVALSAEIEQDTYVLLVEGRADGIDTKGKTVTIDEIKGTFLSMDHLTEPQELHLAQAKCYAAFYTKDHGIEWIHVQITYGNLKTEEIRRFTYTYAAEELRQWFSDLVKRYDPWCRFQVAHRKVCMESCNALSFPYPYREGQWDTISGVYRTLVRSKRLFLQAPTGSGKTLAVLYPSIKAIGQKEGEKIFFLTARTAARTAACDTFRLLSDNGLKMKVLLLTAKERICPFDECLCNPMDCERARGHYDRVRDAVYELLTSEDLFYRETIDSHALKTNVCPFEMELDLSEWCDAIICDYNYVFDPQARLRRFFSDNRKEDYFFLIDEAHNLVDRGRDMFSASLKKEEFLRIKHLLPANAKRLSGALDSCNRFLLAKRREGSGITVCDSVGTFPVSLMNLSGEIEEFLDDSSDAVLNKELLNLYFDVLSFLGACDRLDDSYLIYTEEQDDSFRMHLYCIETARHLQEPLNCGKAAIFFSATLLPVTYYKQLLGDTEDYAIYAKTSFPPENRCVLAVTDISTRYKDRTEGLYARIADCIRTTLFAKKGNYMAFFPSYRMAEEALAILTPLLPKDVTVLLQKPNMTEAERDDFLDAFRTDSSLLGICIMGGIFGEAIDLRGECLIGVIIAGPGLPQVCPERELLMNYYRARDKDGFFYAYLCPGMNKVLQAAGRVIRTEEDKGVILLLDDRFGQNAYRQMFPREWDHLTYLPSRDLKKHLDSFWNS